MKNQMRLSKKTKYALKKFYTETEYKLAKIDWRDLLVYAGFAEDINSHIYWVESLIKAEKKNP